MAILNGDDKLTFGKYKGEFIKDVIKEDASYIMWCCDNIKWFQLDNPTFDEMTTVYGLECQDDGFPGIDWFDFD